MRLFVAREFSVSGFYYQMCLYCMPQQISVYRVRKIMSIMAADLKECLIQMNTFFDFFSYLYS